MKGIVLALLSFGFLNLISIVVVRLYPGKKYFKPLMTAFGLSAFCYAVLFYWIPADLGGLKSPWLIRPSALDFGNGLLILLLLFYGFWDTIYASFFTGFSSGILVHFSKRVPRGLGTGDLVKIYQKDRRGNPVIDVRIQNLVQGRYLLPVGENQYQLLPKGNFFAVMTQAVQKVFHMGAGG